jgi:hypothetical protein
VSSSRRSAGSTPDMVPAVTAADRVSAGLVACAGAFMGVVLARQGYAHFGIAAAASGITFLLIQAMLWTVSRSRPARRLALAADGGCTLADGTAPARIVRLGRGSRLLGPTVVLSLEEADGRARRRRVPWYTPLDLSRETLRRWTVVLRCSGPGASS